ncbi:MAG: hypothetical protein Q4F28_04580 [Eubacteriales bacterium]|nr:hypothetical protein [Eubacteriales bacterium]
MNVYKQKVIEPTGINLTTPVESITMSDVPNGSELLIPEGVEAVVIHKGITTMYRSGHYRLNTGLSPLGACNKWCTKLKEKAQADLHVTFVCLREYAWSVEGEVTIPIKVMVPEPRGKETEKEVLVKTGYTAHITYKINDVNAYVRSRLAGICEFSDAAEEENTAFFTGKIKSLIEAELSTALRGMEIVQFCQVSATCSVKEVIKPFLEKYGIICTTAGVSVQPQVDSVETSNQWNILATLTGYNPQLMALVLSMQGKTGMALPGSAIETLMNVLQQPSGVNPTKEEKWF